MDSHLAPLSDDPDEAPSLAGVAALLLDVLQGAASVHERAALALEALARLDPRLVDEAQETAGETPQTATPPQGVVLRGGFTVSERDGEGLVFERRPGSRSPASRA